MKARLIVNPGGGGSERTQPLLRRAEQQAAGALEVVTIGGGEDVGALAAEAARAEVERLIVAGGDGTISRAVNGLAADFEACELAIVPLGTANDFARTLGLPEDPEAALELALSGHSARVDLVRYLQDHEPPRYLINAATGGFSRSAEDEPGQEQERDEQKEMWGSLAYLRNALGKLTDIPEFEMDLRFNEERPVWVRGSALIVANGRYAGGMPLVPAAELDDHWLEIVAVTAQDFQAQLKLLSQFIVGQHLEAEEGLIYRRSRRLEVNADPPMRFSTDGEPIGETPIQFEIVPSALRLVVP